MAANSFARINSLGKMRSSQEHVSERIHSDREPIPFAPEHMIMNSYVVLCIDDRPQLLDLRKAALTAP